MPVKPFQPVDAPPPASSPTPTSTPTAGRKARRVAAPVDAPPAPADATTRATRAAAIVLLLLLAGWCAAWELWWARTGSGLLALKAAPLLLALPGLVRLRLSTARTLSLLLWLYVCEGLVRAASDTGLSARLAVGEVVLAVALFAVCGWQVRHRLAVGRARAAERAAQQGAGSPDSAAIEGGSIR